MSAETQAEQPGAETNNRGTRDRRKRLSGRVHLGIAIPVFILLAAVLASASIFLVTAFSDLDATENVLTMAKGELAKEQSIEAELRDTLRELRVTRASERERLTTEGWGVQPGSGLAGVYYKYPEDPAPYWDEHCAGESCAVVLVRTDSLKECPTGVRVTGTSIDATGTWEGVSPPLGSGATSVIALTLQSGERPPEGGINIKKYECK